jgi:hypothetical protein
MKQVNDGEQTFYLLRRNPALGPQEFRDYWFIEHAKLLLGLPEFCERRSGYVQNHIAGPDPRDGSPFPYEGVTQSRLRPGAESLSPFLKTASYRERVLPDEQHMLDRASSVVLRTVERVIIPGRSACKVMLFPRRADAEMTPDEFRRRWGGAHRDVVLAQSDFIAFVRGYRQHHLMSDACRYMTGEKVPATEGVDGVTELWFDSHESARQACATSGYTEHILGDEVDSLRAQSIACVVDAREILSE